jgi:excisionase family DNA binding protein
VTEIPALLDVPTLASVLGMTEHGARALLRRGELPASRIGRKWIVRREALYAHLQREERLHARRHAAKDEANPIRALRGLPSRRGPR